jgi:hypothetical protein
MAIDIQGLKLLLIARSHKPLGNVLTLGRQGIAMPKNVIDHIFEHDRFDENEKYCEHLLIDILGATSVKSMDVSSYEGASYIHDMNRPIYEHYDEFDTVFDMGTLEHVYNVPEALKNVSKMCKVGGQILHMLPANNWCGHGFWQMSPELFFTLYSNKNGYAETELFIGSTRDANWTYKIDPPAKGERHDIKWNDPIYCMVRTVKTTTNWSHDNIQQSDYEHEWNKFNE